MMADVTTTPFTSDSWDAFATSTEEEEEVIAAPEEPLQPAGKPTPLTSDAWKAFERDAPAKTAVQSVIANVGISPEEYKGAKAIAKDVGIHARMLVDGTVDKGQARSQQLITQTKNFIAAHPTIAKFLEDPDKVALTYDDLDQLRRVAQAVEAIKESERVQSVSEMPGHVIDVVVNASALAGTSIAQMFMGDNKGAEIGRLQSFLAMLEGFTPEQRAEYDALSIEDQAGVRQKFHLDRSPALKSVVETGQELRDEQQRLGQVSGEGFIGEFAIPVLSEFIQMLPPVIGTMLTRDRRVGAALATSRIVGLSYSEGLSRGLTSEQAAAHAGFFGAVEYLLGQVPLGTLLEEGGGAMTKMLKTAGAEAIEEGAVEVITILYEYGIFDETTTVADAFRRVGMSMAIGGTVGVGMSGTGQGIQATLDAITGSERPKDHATALKRAKEEVDKAKLNVRDPEVMREALAAMSEDGTVFVAAEDIIELQQSGVLASEDVANLELDESVEEVAGRNGDLEVKVANLLTMEKDKFSEMSQVVRETIGAASSKESAQQLKDREQTIAHMLEQMEAQATADPLARPVYDAMLDGLVNVNGMPRADAEQVAALVEEQYNTMAAEDTDGTETAEEMFLRDHVTLRRQPTVSGTGKAQTAPVDLRQDGELRALTVKLPGPDGTMQEVNAGVEYDQITQEREMTQKLLDCVNGS
jgi:hypothetical protein